jgi:hypothetical protein
VGLCVNAVVVKTEGFDNGFIYNNINNNYYTVALGGLVVSVLATGLKVRGFKPGRGRWIRSTPSFGGEGKPSVPCRRFMAC